MGSRNNVAGWIGQLFLVLVTFLSLIAGPEVLSTPYVKPEDFDRCLEHLLPPPEEIDWASGDLDYRVEISVQPELLPPFRITAVQKTDGSVDLDMKVLKVRRNLQQALDRRFKKDPSIPIMEICSKIRVKTKTGTYSPGSQIGELVSKLRNLEHSPLVNIYIVLHPNTYDLRLTSFSAESHYSWAGLDPLGEDSHPLSDWIWELAEALNLKLNWRAEARKH